MVTNTENSKQTLKAGVLDGITAIKLGDEYIAIDHQAELGTFAVSNDPADEPSFFPEPLCPPLTPAERLSHFNFNDVPEEDRQDIIKLVTENFDVFAFPDKPLGCTKILKSKIELIQIQIFFISFNQYKFLELISRLK
jgi:hypothetical protein